MDTETARILNSINNEFYSKNAHSFSETRQRSWPGWERLVEVCGSPSSVLDMACGNRRFERFLLKNISGNGFDYYGIDVCEELADGGVSGSFQRLDLVEAALAGCDLCALVQAPPCDLVVSFGFMHHVPGLDARMHIMKVLVDKTAPGGTLCVSFWRFMDDSKLASKARGVTERALPALCVALDTGDFFLDWQGDETSLRYCHSFTDDEVDMLVESVSDSCEEELRYRADGKTSDLNTYIVLRRA